jgi:hypothetical protein
MPQDGDQHRVLEDVGVVAGVESVAIAVHPANGNGAAAPVALSP